MKNILILLLFITITILYIGNVSAQQNSQVMSGDVFGLKGSIEISGEHPMQIKIKNNELESLHTSKNVKFVSEDMILYCNDFDFKKPENKIIATGSPVMITQKDVKANCGKMEYFIDKNLTILRDNPVLYQEDGKGGSTKVSGETITITQNKAANGAASVHADGSDKIPATLTRIPAPKQTAAEGEAAAHPKLEEIKSPKELSVKTPEMSTDSTSTDMVQ